MTNKREDDHEVVPFPKTRHIIVGSLRQGHGMHTIYALTEVDVTRARQYIREHKARTGETLSFTAFIASCMAQAVDEDKYVQAYRKGRNKLVIFNDVDIDILVEREVDGVRVPVAPRTIRAANKKTYREIHEEIRATQAEEVKETYGPLKWYLALPSFITRLVSRVFWWRFFRDPHLRMRFGGTVGITAVGMFGRGAGWGIPISTHTLGITLGGIVEKPGVVDGRIETREYLSMTISFDHDIVDGAPAARFTQRLKDLIESGHALIDQDLGSTELRS